MHGPKLMAPGSLCDQDKITTGGNDIEDQVCVKQPSTKSIRMPSGGGQRGIYCLQLYGDFNCNDLETSVSVKFAENDGICKTLDGINDMGKPISTIFASYRWVKSCNGNVSPQHRLLSSEKLADVVVSQGALGGTGALG